MRYLRLRFSTIAAAGLFLGLSLAVMPAGAQERRQIDPEQACKGDASDANVARVKITPRDIDSVFGLCTILNRKRDGNTFAVHVECKGPGNSQMGCSVATGWSP